MSCDVFFTREWPGNAAEVLEASGLQVEVWPDFNRPDASEIQKRMEEGALAVITTVEDPIEAATIVGETSKLRIVAQAGVGFDNLDVVGLADVGIWCTNTPGVLDDATADLAFALMCSLARRIPEADRYVREGQWTCWHPGLLLGKELAGATVGIVGLGRIGMAFARRCTGFGMNILYTARGPKEEAAAMGAQYCTLDELLSQAEIVSLHVPLTEKTKGLMDESRLRLMRPDAILVNTARGAVVDQRALHRALEDGWIQGAALDVTDPEPLPADDPLLSAPNLVIAPHIGSAGHRTRERMAVMAAENVLAVLRGESPPNALRDISEGMHDSG
jgi:lactate dehydrogenase-like 2-hydroxyacid dehydrogenase